MFNKLSVFIASICLGICATTFAQHKETVLPLTFNSVGGVGGLPSVVLKIQGKRVPVIIDTGAEETISLTPHGLKGINYKYTGKKVCNLSFYGTQCYREIVIPNLELGGVTLHNVKGKLEKNLFENHATSKDEAVKSGAIGLELLSRFNMLLNYPQSKLVLTDSHNPTGYDLKNWITIPFQMDHGIITHAKVNQKRTTLVWDTGSLPSVIRNRSAERIYEGYRKYDVKIHNQTLAKTKFLVTNIPRNLPLDGTIGSNFYQHHLVFFDFGHKLIYIKNDVA